MIDQAPLLTIDRLSVSIPAVRRMDRAPGDLVLVKDVSFSIRPGERLALVGESGSGKSMTARAIMKLDRDVHLHGAILWDGEDLIPASEPRMRRLRGHDISMIFQDPMTALNPVLTIGEQIAEPLVVRGVPRREAWTRAAEILDSLRVPKAKERLKAYPGEFSGGMRQRVVMAAALIAKPRLLIADEPTTALDVRVQEQVLDLIYEQSEELGLSVLFITHDLSLVAGLAHEVCVMYRGELVEKRDVDSLFADPSHPYTRGMLASIPRLTSDSSERLRTVDEFMSADGGVPHV